MHHSYARIHEKENLQEKRFPNKNCRQLKETKMRHESPLNDLLFKSCAYMSLIRNNLLGRQSRCSVQSH